MKKLFFIIPCIFFLLAFSCKKQEKKVTFDVSQEWANITKQHGEITKIREEMKAIKDKIKILEDYKSNPKKYKKEELPPETLESLKTNLENIKKTNYEPKYDSFMDALALFLDKVLNDEELKNYPEVPKATRLYADECIISGEEFIREGGKYKDAIEIYNQALAIEPNYELLKQKIKEAEDYRYIKKERFDQVKNGMTMEEVIQICGYPNILNIKEKEEKDKKIVAWFYPREDQKGAGVFFSQGKVYNKLWDASK